MHEKKKKNTQEMFFENYSSNKKDSKMFRYYANCYIPLG